MSWIDWSVLIGTLLLIVLYGSWKTRKNNNLESYLKGNNSEGWMTIGLSIMATQASAITFLSTPGQAYESGMGFIQFYFGLPLAMILISIFFLPIYYRLKVYTAYQYLEQRFDGKVRSLTASLFLISRGLAAGITIYAPAIILSTLLGWNLQLTCIVIGVLVIIYTVSGGSRAVSLTQKWQMTVIMGGMFAAFYFVLESFPEGVGFKEGITLAGNLGKMEVINTSLDFENRYTIWSGLTGGLFLFMSYFGTDQSQVQRYLGGKTLKESRLGLMFNGIMKIPMQFFILLVGIMVFVSFQFNKPPIIFNETNNTKQYYNEDSLTLLRSEYDQNFKEKETAIASFLAGDNGAIKQVQLHQSRQDELRKVYKTKLSKLDETYGTKDSDYVFLTFVLNFLPIGLIGLLLAVIFSAAMSSTAGELNALASTTTIDFYKKYWAEGESETKNIADSKDFEKSYEKRLPKTDKNSDAKDLKASKWLTVGWGVLAIIIALTAGLFENLIELVNILGSLFYGTILGVFLLAFFFKTVKGEAAFFGALVGQATVLMLHVLNTTDKINLGYLWYNVIGSIVVILAALIIQTSRNGTKTEKTIDL